MQIRTDLPRPVRVVEHLWIPLPDGTRLAARAWLPEDAERDPVPAILDAVPYRKGDGTAAGDMPSNRYLAGHGYADVETVDGPAESLVFALPPELRRELRAAEPAPSAAGDPAT